MVGPALAANPQAGQAVYHADCQLCHGAHGEGTAFGRSMGVPNLQSPAVQHQSGAALRAFVTTGGGKMPSAARIGLTATDVANVVAYLRVLK